MSAIDSLRDAGQRVLGQIATPAAEEIDATPETVFDVLANERRRLVIHALAEAEGEPIALGDLAEAIAAAENDCPPAQLTTQQRKRVYVGLYQTHMEQIVAAGAAVQAHSGHATDTYRATPTTHVLDGLAERVEAQCTQTPRREDLDAVADTVADVAAGVTVR